MPVWSKRIAALLAWLPPVLWMAAIFTMSSVPGVEVAQSASRIEELLPVVGKVLVHPVTVHIVAYALLSVLMFVEMRSRKASVLRAGLTALLIAVVYGGTDELHQAFVPGRSSSPADLGFDALGALAGVLAAWLAVRAATAWRSRAKTAAH